MEETIHLVFHTFLSQEWCCKKYIQEFNKVTRKIVEKPVNHACLQCGPILYENFVTHRGQRVYRWLTLHSVLTTTMKISPCLLFSGKEGLFWHWIIYFSWFWDVWRLSQTNVLRTVNVKMVIVELACVYAILDGGVASVSFVDSGEKTDYFGVHH